MGCTLAACTSHASPDSYSTALHASKEHPALLLHKPQLQDKLLSAVLC
jgi:hypothetical protein